jgi:hypothetical protein
MRIIILILFLLPSHFEPAISLAELIDIFRQKKCPTPVKEQGIA